MQLELIRYSANEENTVGIMFLDDVFQCYTIEDEKREIKVPGETRIPDGTYEIRFREVISPKTERYRKRYDWFTWHLWLQNVPNFQYVYIHIGNDDSDSDGCLLVGDTVTNNKSVKGLVGESTRAFQRLYEKVKPVLESGGKVSIEVRQLKDNI